MEEMNGKKWVDKQKKEKGENMESGEKRSEFHTEMMKEDVKSEEEHVSLRKAPRCFSMQLICILISEQETNQLIQFCLSVSLFMSFPYT